MQFPPTDPGALQNDQARMREKMLATQLDARRLGTKARVWIAGVLALLTAAPVVSLSVSLALAARAPDMALRFFPWSGIANGRQATRLATPDMSDVAARSAKAHALRSINRTPGSVDAARTLAIVADKEGDGRSAQRWLDYVAFLTKRDLPTELWQIERSVQANDIGGALHHFDQALRTSKSAPPILYPVLMGALIDPVLLNPIASMLAQKPVWANAFLRFLVGNGGSDESVARLFFLLDRKGAPVDPVITADFIGQAVERGKYDGAWTVYRTTNPGAVRGDVVDSTFRRASASLPFDWSPVDEMNRHAELTDDQLKFSGSSGAEGMLAQQLILLAPGRHRIRSTISELAVDGEARWIIQCIGPVAATIASLDLGKTAPVNASRAIDFDVPTAGCGAQWLRLEFSSALGSESKGSIRAIRIDPLPHAR